MDTFFFTKVLKSARSCDSWKQIELDDIVDNMKNFQEWPQQSDKWNCPDLQVSAGKSYNHHSRKRSFSATGRFNNN